MKTACSIWSMHGTLHFENKISIGRGHVFHGLLLAQLLVLTATVPAWEPTRIRVWFGNVNGCHVAIQSATFMVCYWVFALICADPNQSQILQAWAPKDPISYGENVFLQSCSILKIPGLLLVYPPLSFSLSVSSFFSLLSFLQLCPPGGASGATSWGL